MLKIEDIESISKPDRYYHIIFNDGSRIRLRYKTELFPLLLLIRYGTCNKYDYFGAKYVYIKNTLADRSISETFERNYHTLHEGFKHLIYDEGFDFIKRDYRDRFVNYTLELEDHPKLLREQIASFYKLERNDMEEIYIRQGRTCNMCKKYLEKTDVIIDYVIPLSRGGDEKASNAQILCSDCYKKKRNECKNCILECNIKNCPLTIEDNTENNEIFWVIEEVEGFEGS